MKIKGLLLAIALLTWVRQTCDEKRFTSSISQVAVDCRDELMIL